MIKAYKNTTGEPINIFGLKYLFILELKQILWIEKESIKLLNYIKEEAASEELKDSFEEHADISEIHEKRLEEVFSLLKLKPEAQKSFVFEGIRKDIEYIITNIIDPYTKDAALISAVQKLEHLEIAAYGCLRSYAGLLGLKDPMDLLQITLDEEFKADETLTEIAESIINESALA